ncbi:F-box family protein [Striga asiatica]|uniref:F-box family protein n=1 Tax=Striga asiatica TaxID=4170 RepID=A0A5A7R9S4_STRAF|nr:F-box family protein [Striga asiatica]
MASLNLNPNPLFKPSSFPVGWNNNPLFKPSSFPVSWKNKKNKSSLESHNQRNQNPSSISRNLGPGYVKTIHNYFGFAYDSTSNDYKVIRFLRRSDDSSCSLALAELYSLKTNSWKRVDFRPYSFHPWGDPFAKINANGTYYWLNNVDHNFIQSFNFATEKFDSYRVPMPPSDMFKRHKFGPKFCRKKLVEYRGSIGFLAKTSKFIGDVNYSVFELWVWDDASLLWRLESTFLVNKMRSFMGLFENDKLFYLRFSLHSLILVSDMVRISWAGAEPGFNIYPG